MSKHIEAPAVGSHTQEQAVQTDHPEHHLEMVRQELFQAQQALLNEGQQRDKLLAALDSQPQSPVPLTEAEFRVFKLGWLECRAGCEECRRESRRKTKESTID